MKIQNKVIYIKQNIISPKYIKNNAYCTQTRNNISFQSNNNPNNKYKSKAAKHNSTNIAALSCVIKTKLMQILASKMYTKKDDDINIQHLPADCRVIDLESFGNVEIPLLPDRKYAIKDIYNPKLEIRRNILELNRLNLERGALYYIEQDKKSNTSLNNRSSSNLRAKVQYIDGYYLIETCNSSYGTKLKIETNDYLTNILNSSQKVMPMGYSLIPNQKYKVNKYNNTELKIGRKTIIPINNLKIENGKTIILGKGRNCDVKITNDNAVSQKNTKITRFGNQYIIEDLKSTKGTKLYANPDITNLYELCRNFQNDRMPVPHIYKENNRLARQEILNGLYSGKSLNNTKSYIDVLNKAHFQACRGSGLYYKDSEGHLLTEEELRPGIQRKNMRNVNNRFGKALEVEEIAIKYKDKYRARKEFQKVLLDGIPSQGLPTDTFSNNIYTHYYPDSIFLEEYNEQLFRTHYEVIKEIQKFIKGHSNQIKILTKIAQHYQYGANARPYNHINNSLFMNEVNTYLQLAGMPKITQGNLDHTAQRLQPNTFCEYFIDYYLENQLV